MQFCDAATQRRRNFLSDSSTDMKQKSQLHGRNKANGALKKLNHSMFTAVAHKNLADAESYFDEHLAQNDYYAAGEIRPGQWIGAGAERLGLKDNVTREQFHALCENQNPQNDERLTQRTIEGRTSAGYFSISPARRPNPFRCWR